MHPKFLQKFGNSQNKIIRKQLYLSASLSPLFYQKLGLSYISFWCKTSSEVFFRPSERAIGFIYDLKSNTEIQLENEWNWEVMISDLELNYENIEEKKRLTDSVQALFSDNFSSNLVRFYDSFSGKTEEKEMQLSQFKFSFMSNSSPFFAEKYSNGFPEIFQKLQDYNLKISNITFNNMFEIPFKKEESKLIVELISYKTKTEELWKCLENHHQHALELLNQIQDNFNNFSENYLKKDYKNYIANSPFFIIQFAEKV